jgi:hypothetical protein
MKSYSCDHCRQSIGVGKLSAGRGVAGPEGWLSVRVSTVGRETEKASFQYDICDACRVEFQKFLGGVAE